LLGGELPEAEVVHDQDVPGEPATQLALEGVVGARGVQGMEQLGGLDVADGMPGAAGGVAEGLREVAFPHADTSRARARSQMAFRRTEPRLRIV
jgi:hypothetical protein